MSSVFDPIAYINTPRWQASRLGLERTRELLKRMGCPQDELRFVHVAGTNGKGSVCSYVARVLEEAGYKTGLFTSPYIETFEERIRVNGENISLADLTRATLSVREHASAMEAETGDHPTEFELMFAVALEHFRAVSCDIVVLEVGLGGRLDSTNAIDAPEVSVICRIGLDHTELLGNTLGAVAREKAGIVKAGAPVVSWPQEPEAAEVVARVAQERGCSLITPDFAQLAVSPLSWEGESVPKRVFAYKGVPFETQLLGSYQPANAALAVEVVSALRKRGWAISDEALVAGIANTTWPGRFEVVGKNPLVIVDGGHNPQGAEALAASLADLLSARRAPDGRACAPWGEPDSDELACVSLSASGGQRAPQRTSDGLTPAPQRAVVFVMGVLADKDYPAMIASVAPFARGFVTYKPRNPRALSASDLAESIKQSCAALSAGAIDRSCAASSARAIDQFCATPSANAIDQSRVSSSAGTVDQSYGTLSAAAADQSRAALSANVAGQPCSNYAAAVSGQPFVEAAESPEAAVARACEIAGEDGVVVAFGTLYAVGDIKAALRSK